MHSTRTAAIVALLAIALSDAASNRGATAIAISPNDLNSNQALLYDNVGAFTETYAPDGVIHDVAYDPVNGALYALTQAGVYIKGSAISVPFSPPLATNTGADITVSPGAFFALTRSDGGNSIEIFHKSGAAMASWVLSSTVYDIAYDPASLNLYALTSNGVYLRTAAGAVSQIISTTTAVAGGDIAVGPQQLALSLSDLTTQVVLFDLTTLASQTWGPRGYVADISYDPLTGDLYAFTNTGVHRRSPDGSAADLGIISVQQFNVGSDIAVFNNAPPPPPDVVPEPGSFVLWSLLVCVGVFAPRCVRNH